MKFNSQICTTREQSERLTALGLKKETADCMHNHCWTSEDGIVDDIPAWSLHRLIEMIQTVFLRVNICGWWVHIERRIYGEEYCGDKHNNIYDNIIDCIEWIIKEGYFNEEYLENEMEEKV